MSSINLHLVEIALQRADGTEFEKFCQAFFAALTGLQFVPLGGMHDGGAEAFTEASVFQTKPEHFWQASIEKTTSSKIRRTVRRLREFGRNPNQLTYCTSIVVPNVDGEEDSLSDELGLRVKIRDQKYIVSHINYSPATVDLLIRALSEYNLPDADRMTWNMFKILQAAGATLILPEKTLEEIISHIRAADQEFRRTRASYPTSSRAISSNGTK